MSHFGAKNKGVRSTHSGTEQACLVCRLRDCSKMEGVKKRPLRCKHIKRSLKAQCSRMEELPAGPSSVTELFDWPSTVIDMATHDEVARLYDLFLRRQKIRSEYSGMCSEQEALTRPFQLLNEKYQWGMCEEKTALLCLFLRPWHDTIGIPVSLKHSGS